MSTRFRILVIGRANSGKTTILRRVCNATGEPVIFSPNGERIDPSVLNPTLRRGEHDIENQMIFEDYPNFIFHDSPGFEDGSKQLKLVQEFIERRSVSRNVNERLDAIWYCIQTSDSRPVTAAEKIIFDESGTGLVPVISLWTKTETLDIAKIKQLEREGYSRAEAMQQAPEKAWAEFQMNILPLFDAFKYPPKAHIRFRKMYEPGANCKDLMNLTALLLGDHVEPQENYGVRRVRNSTESVMLEDPTGKRGDPVLMSAQNVLITDSHFVKLEKGDFHKHTHTHTHVHRSKLEELREVIAHGALHDAKGRNPPRCHPSTRRSVLKKIREWVEGLETIHSRRFMWLYGSVGVGKTALAQTIAELYFEQSILAASFFFSGMADCNNSTLFIATIACQLCSSIPEVKPYIEAAVERNPDILQLSLELQVQKLIIWPLSGVKFWPRSSQSISPQPNLIVIDGLDECGSEDMQCSILDALSGIFKSHNFPIYFFVTSRPEPHIHESFHAEPLSTMTAFISLDNLHLPDNDVEVFLRSEFNDIKRKHPYIPPSWPSEMDVKQLVQQSSDHFIYASMVVEYVKSPQHLPTTRLDNIITARGSDAPFAELDAQYNRIFSTVDDIHTVLQVLSILLFSKEHWFPCTVNLKLMEDLLDLKRDVLDRKLIRLHSVLDIPALDDDKTEIRILHPSLGAFLQDQTRSGQYFIDWGNAHAKLTQRLMSLIPSVREECHSMDELPRLSCQFFMVHCASSYPTPELLENLRNFDISAFLSLLSSEYPLGLSPVTINRQIADLFTWLDHQSARELYASYLQAWDKHILTSLLAMDPPHARLAEVFVVSSLHPQFWKHCTIIQEIINWREPQGEVVCLSNSSLQSLCAGLGKLDEEESNSAGYYKMVSEFLNDSSRSDPFYADEAKFTHLATKTVEFIMDSEVKTTKFPFTNYVLLHDELHIWASQCLPFFLSRASFSRVLATLLETKLLPLVKQFKYSGQKKKSDVINAINCYINQTYGGRLG